MEIIETTIAGTKLTMRLADKGASLDLTVELSRLRLADGSPVVPGLEKRSFGELQQAALRYLREALGDEIGVRETRPALAVGA